MDKIVILLEFMMCFTDESPSQTPEINIHNYSDNVEIELKVNDNQVDVYIEEKEKKVEAKDKSYTDNKWLSGGERT